MGQERRIGAVRNISALPPRADVGADIVEQPVSANSRCARTWPVKGQAKERTFSATADRRLYVGALATRWAKFSCPCGTPRSARQAGDPQI